MTSANIQQVRDDEGADIAISAPSQSRLLYLENQDFNDALNDRNEACLIDDVPYLPSEVLYAVDYNAYVEALHQFRQEQAVAFTKLIYEQFPPLIAYPFYRAERGYENLVQRMLFLRDVWESLIHTLFAIVVGEFCATGTPFQTDKVTKKKLLSDRLSDKLEIIDVVLQTARQQRLPLAACDLIDSEGICRLRELNRARNGFSHEAAKSENQARQLYTQYRDEVFSVLQSLKRLCNYRLLRYVGQDSILEMRCEIFQGHSTTKTIETLELTTDQVKSWSRFLNRQTLLVMVKDRLFTVAPFLHFFESDTGQYTRLAFYKKKQHGQFVFEVVGESRSIEVPESMFATQVVELTNLLSVSARGS